MEESVVMSFPCCILLYILISRNLVGQKNTSPFHFLLVGWDVESETLICLALPIRAQSGDAGWKPSSLHDPEAAEAAKATS